MIYNQTRLRVLATGLIKKVPYKFVDVHERIEIVHNIYVSIKSNIQDTVF